VTENGAIEVVVEDDGTVTKVAVYHRNAEGTKAWTHPFTDEARKECDQCRSGLPR
jgi:hypothetical protein